MGGGLRSHTVHIEEIDVMMVRNDRVATSCKEKTTDMQDDMTVLHTTPNHMSYLPMPSLAHSIPCPASDRCDTVGVSVSPSRRSTPVISNIQTTTLPTHTFLTFTWTQVLWFLSRLTRSRTSGVTTRPVTSLTIISTRATQCM